MSELALTLLRPWWLLALPPIALYGAWLYRQRGGIGDWQRAAHPALLRALAALGRIEGAASRNSLYAMLATAALAVVALSGPAIERRDTLSFRNLDGVVFVLDASTSVTASGRWPQLLTIGRFGMAALGSRPAALVVFAGDAYVATDMTQDVRQLGQTLSLIGPETVPDPGSRPARGLALALDMFEDAGLLAGDVILMTDGAGLDRETMAMAGALAEREARLSVVALDVVDAEMTSLARIGAGRVFTLDQTDALANWLSDAARTELVRQDYPLLYWHDLGRYLLLAAMLPLLLVLRRSSP